MEVGLQPEAKPLVCVRVCVVGKVRRASGGGGVGGLAEWTRRLAQHSLCHQSFLFSEEHF